MTPDETLRDEPGGLRDDETFITQSGVAPEIEDPFAELVAQGVTIERGPPDVEGDLEPEQELMTINMGPHHPATHGVLRLIVTLQGEQVLDVKPVVGYVHTGIEKSCEQKSYWKVIPYVERMDYLAYFFNMQAYCGCVEQLLEMEIPDRASYLRMLHMELNRIHSHLVWLGTSALDLGAISMFWYCFRERDADARPVRDVGRPADAHALLPGRRRLRGHPARVREEGEGVLAEMPSRIDQFEALLDQNEIFLQRTKNIGIVTRERLLELGVTGPLLRAAGEPWDLRKTDRLPLLRRARLQDPGRDRRRRLRPLPLPRRRDARVGADHRAVPRRPARGPVIADDRKIVLPPRDELGTSMEALIHHFKLVTEGFRVPPGELYYPIEGPRGELGCFIVADGSAKPARVHFRDSSFVNLQALRDMCVGGYVADLIQNLAMLDPILGGIDR